MAKPKLALIPSAQGSKFYSVLPSSGVGDFDFSRSGSATRINSQGLIETVGNGVSRLNYPMIDGVVSGCPHHILEPQRANLLPYSEDFSQSVWTKSSSTVTSNAAISPDGTQNASKIFEDTSNGIHRLYPNFTVNSQKHTSSIFAKKGTRNWIFLRLDGAASDQRTWFDLENGVIGTVNSDHNASIENYGNGWYKCSISTKGTTYQAAYTVIGISNEDNSFLYTGSANKFVYFFGAQVEASSYPTSYIPTNGTAVTRSAETANGSGDASTFNDSEGVLMAEISALANDGNYRQISINDSSTNNRITLDFTNTDNQIRSFISFNGTSQALMVGNAIATNQSKAAVSYKRNDFSLWLNGFKVDTDTIGSVPTGLNNLNFDNGGGANDFYGNTKQVQYYDSVLTDSELETLTSWVSFSDMANGQQYIIE